MNFRDIAYFRTVDKKKMLHLTSLVLLILMFFKVSAFHVYTHQDNSSNQIENCKICDSAIENQNAEHLSVSTVFVEMPKIASVQTQAILGDTQIFIASKVHFRLFGRPPPTLI